MGRAVREVFVRVVWLLTPCRTVRQLLDRQDRIVGVLVGRPDDPGWDAVAQEASRAMEEARKNCYFKKKDKDHRRGVFATLARGASFGGGQQVSHSFALRSPSSTSG